MHAGARFDLWCGCYTSQREHIALLACVALNGYRASADYIWEFNNLRVASHDTPLMYCNQVGVYTCYVTCDDRTACRQFKVEGIYTV